MKDEKGRVDFGMAEALAYGTLALHRGVRPKDAHPGSDQPQQVVVHPGRFSTNEDLQGLPSSTRSSPGAALHFCLLIGLQMCCYLWESYKVMLSPSGHHKALPCFQSWRFKFLVGVR